MLLPAVRLAKHARIRPLLYGQTYAYKLQKEVDFWVYGARREGVSSRKHQVSANDGGIVHTVAEDGTPISDDSVGSSSESPQETVRSSRGRRRGRFLPPENGDDDDAVDRLVRATCTMGGDEGRKGDLFDWNAVGEHSTASVAAAERTPRLLDQVEISSTAVAAGAGRGWFWGATT